MVKIAVLVSGGGTNLQALLDAEARGEIKNGKISLVLSSSPGAYALKRAEAAGVPAAALRPKDFPDRAAYSDALLERLEAEGIGLVVLAGFLYLLSPAFVAAFQNRILNVHPSLIPAFAGEGCYGIHVHEKALAYGVKVTGATVIFVNEDADGGPIVLQKAAEVLPGDTPETLQRRVMETCEWEILPRAVSLFCEGRLHIDGRVVHILDVQGE